MLRAVGHPVAVNPDAELSVPGRSSGRSSASIVCGAGCGSPAAGWRWWAGAVATWWPPAAGRASRVDAEGSAGSLPDSSGAVLPGCRISTLVGSGAQPWREADAPPYPPAVERRGADPCRARCSTSAAACRGRGVAEAYSVTGERTSSRSSGSPSPSRSPRWSPPAWPGPRHRPDLLHGRPRGLLGARPRGDVRHRGPPPLAAFTAVPPGACATPRRDPTARRPYNRARWRHPRER